jgi:divalent metal cation (Fe/Co/Zn/Cd) transporter
MSHVSERFASATLSKSPLLPSRDALVRRARRLAVVTLTYNSLEGMIAIAAGLAAGSVALVGFGVDSGIELAASLTALFRLARDADITRRAQAEQRANRIIGALFLSLAIYVTYDAALRVWQGRAPAESMLGIALAAASLVVMPILARAKRRVATRLGSRALQAEAMQTMVCTWLSAILLAGLALNALVGWWWADPVAALMMVPLITREGIEGLRGHAPCCDDCQSAIVSPGSRSSRSPPFF